MDNVRGRIDDFMIFKNGRKLSPHSLCHSLDPVRGIKRWKLVQDGADKLTVEIEPIAEFTAVARATVERNLKELTGGELAISILLRDRIPIDPAVKFRAVSSHIRLPQ